MPPPFVPTYRKFWSWMIFITKFLLEMFRQSVSWACAVTVAKARIREYSSPTEQFFYVNW